MGVEKPAYTISVLNQKGGVGKTTTAQHLGYALAAFHKKNVLLIDSDPQGNLTHTMGIDPGKLEATLFDVLKGDAALSSIIMSYGDLEGGSLDIAPANIQLSRAEVELVREINATFLLKTALTDPLMIGEGSYDYVIIDCPPSLGILTINALAASSHVLVPIQPEMYALQGLDALQSTIEKVRLRANPRLEVLGWLITLHDGRTRIHKDVTALFRQRFGAKICDTVISLNTTLREAQMARRTIWQYDSSRTGATNYQLLAEEVIGRLEG